MKRLHRMPFGAQTHESGTTLFRLWAPSAQSVLLKMREPEGERVRPMSRTGDGWCETRVDHARSGLRYVYRIDDEIDVPDPASRFNPEGVHEASMLVDPLAYEWQDEEWQGHAWNELVIYELHVGTFTQPGTYAALEARLPDLAKLGITALELMPLASFAGGRGWGYDGVLPYAPHAAYGAPDELKRLIDRAHALRLSVLIDVVYNHFGPDGNYLSLYAPEFFTSKHQTPWGNAIAFDQPIVRQFFIDNALYWLNEYHVDGLRIDAVHAMYDDGPRHFIDELIDAVQDGPGRERRVHIVLENHHNEARRLRRPRVSQWNDDFHHALHVLLTHETESYYTDYAEHPLEQLGRALAQGFVYQGERSRVSGETRGEPSGSLSPLAFINFLQNHDQIGNRAFGERLAALAPSMPLAAMYAVLLLAPQIPLLFMGEEYAADQPFLYFCDYQGELADAIRQGRRNEFAAFAAFSDESRRARIPDPNAHSTFQRSTLVWAERSAPKHWEWLEYVTALLHIRRSAIVPLVEDIAPGQSSYVVQENVLSVRWPLASGAALTMIVNLSDKAAELPALPAERELYSTAGASSEQVLRPWEVRVFAPERRA